MLKNSKIKIYWTKLRPYCIAVFSIYLVLSLFARKLTVEGNSMEPEYHDGDRLRVNSMCYLVSEPQRFDVVVVQTEMGNLIKRVIALPGETIQINDEGNILINGEKIEDPYAKENIQKDMRGLVGTPFTLKNDEYFVMGDNRNASTDSRIIGPIQKKQIIGKIREKR